MRIVKKHQDLENSLSWLASGEIELIGRIVHSRNAVFVVQIETPEREGLAIYKPREGEYPLWDFLAGTLCRREVAAYCLSRSLGWPPIPPTVLRDGPLGTGMVQQFIEADPEATYFTLREERLAHLLAVAAFDHLTNNADRKAGHLLVDAAGQIWAIDHALTFHVEPKLRTVIWDFAGQPIPERCQRDLRRVDTILRAGQPLEQELRSLLTSQEISALRRRLGDLLTSGRFPAPDPDRRQVPWPLI